MPNRMKSSATKNKQPIRIGHVITGIIARVADQKDYETLAKAAARVIAFDSDVRFLIVGDNSRGETYRRHYEKVQKLLDEHGVAENFIFTGHQDECHPVSRCNGYIRLEYS